MNSLALCIGAAAAAAIGCSASSKSDAPPIDSGTVADTGGVDTGTDSGPWSIDTSVSEDIGSMVDTSVADSVFDAIDSAKPATPGGCVVGSGARCDEIPSACDAKSICGAGGGTLRPAGCPSGALGACRKPYPYDTCYGPAGTNQVWYEYPSTSTPDAASAANYCTGLGGTWTPS